MGRPGPLLALAHKRLGRNTKDDIPEKLTVQFLNQHKDSIMNKLSTMGYKIDRVMPANPLISF